jgi:hypothetical protein
VPSLQMKRHARNTLFNSSVSKIKQVRGTRTTLLFLVRIGRFAIRDLRSGAADVLRINNGAIVKNAQVAAGRQILGINR